VAGWAVIPLPPVLIGEAWPRRFWSDTRVSDEAVLAEYAQALGRGQEKKQ